MASPRQRLYKMISLLDLEGLSFAHTGSALIDILKKYNTLFGFYFPEVSSGRGRTFVCGA